jgi:hypothetical protein
MDTHLELHNLRKKVEETELEPNDIEDLYRIARRVNYNCLDYNFECAIDAYDDISKHYHLSTEEFFSFWDLVMYHHDSKFTGEMIDQVDFRPTKRRRMNDPYDGAHLHPVSHKVTCEMDSVIFCQRLWKEEAYKPGGKMYKKLFERFNRNIKSVL